MPRVDHGSPQAGPPAPCVGILLAGGQGRRFAAASGGQDKLLARLADGTAVAVRAAAALREATDAVVAVVRPESAALAALLRGQGCHVLESEQAREGMGASLAAAASFLLAGPVPDMPQRADVCLVALADMPWVRRDTLSAVRAAACADGITVPVHQGRRGHPVAFGRSLWGELAALRGDVGARELLRRHRVAAVEVDDPGVAADVDTPGDLAGDRA
ncbi:NTP transferase domain-containing protein [Bordetella bronchiseptica]|uniref:nucleotidyltransferase family protein n=1 Tax=Bordetella bronchiseptica TaxID=518 RepID=UPI00067E3173|nr:nucleotidyltransferase family protein [Bordetella bronchiseptica]